MAEGQKAIRFDIIRWIFDTYAPTRVATQNTVYLIQQIICCGFVADSEASIEDIDVGAAIIIIAVYRLSGQGSGVRIHVVQFDGFQEYPNSALVVRSTIVAPSIIVEAGMILLTSGCGQGSRGRCHAVVEVVDDDAGDISTERLSGSLAVEPCVSDATLV